jgi:hypothetical protein
MEKIITFTLTIAITIEKRIILGRFPKTFFVWKET